MEDTSQDLVVVDVSDTRQVEVVPSTPGYLETFRDVSNAINNGAFAVLLTAFIILWFARGFVKRAVDSYEELMVTLKRSVENNSKVIDRIADSQTRMVDILGDFKHSPYGYKIIQELEKQAGELREINESKRKDTP